MEFPNIVFIFADDLGYGDMSCYGATKINTPNIDKIAREGARFTDVHSSSAVCTPSRYSVITGRYCWRTRLKKWVISGFGEPLIEQGRMTIANILKNKGYSTAAIGKWHLGLDWSLKDPTSTEDRDKLDFDPWKIDYDKKIENGPTTLGFDYYFGIAGSLDMAPYCYIENDHTVGKLDHEKKILYNQQRRGLTTDNWKDQEVDIKFTEKAKEFIDNHTKQHKDKPFFLYFPTASPHRPCDVRPDFVINKSQAGDRGDMVILFDWIVGQIADKIEELNLTNETIFIISSDNGARLRCANGKTYGHTPNGILRGQKSDIWDGGHREPFIIRWPGKIKPDTTNDELMCLVDLFSTFAAITDQEIPKMFAEDSFNMLPAILKQTNEVPIRNHIIHHSGEGMFSIRRGKWKLIKGLGSGGFSSPGKQMKTFWRPEGQLYNLEEDIKEKHNIWKKYPEIVRELSAELEKIISSNSKHIF